MGVVTAFEAARVPAMCKPSAADRSPMPSAAREAARVIELMPLFPTEAFFIRATLSWFGES